MQVNLQTEQSIGVASELLAFQFTLTIIKWSNIINKIFIKERTPSSKTKYNKSLKKGINSKNR